jgi:hypothetical protein
MGSVFIVSLLFLFYRGVNATSRCRHISTLFTPKQVSSLQGWNRIV